jgi:hypothetical protein
MIAMQRSIGNPSRALLLALVASIGACGSEEQRLTGYVEGEERVLRSEVAGRIRAVPTAKAMSSARATSSPRSTRPTSTRIATKRAELASTRRGRGAGGADRLTESTWQADVKARSRRGHAHARRSTSPRRPTGVKPGFAGRTTSVEALDQASSQRDKATSVLQQAEGC